MGHIPGVLFCGILDNKVILLGLFISVLFGKNNYIHIQGVVLCLLKGKRIWGLAFLHMGGTFLPSTYIVTYFSTDWCLFYACWCNPVPLWLLTLVVPAWAIGSSYSWLLWPFNKPCHCVFSEYFSNFLALSDATGSSWILPSPTINHFFSITEPFYERLYLRQGSGSGYVRCD